MATGNFTIDDTWNLIITGPTSENATISPLGTSCQIAIASTAPAETLVGFRIHSNDSYVISLGTGENLYVRSTGGNITIVVNT